jgi:hypothetical protein
MRYYPRARRKSWWKKFKKPTKNKNCLLTRADRISLEFLSCLMVRKDFSQLFSGDDIFVFRLSLSWSLFKKNLIS